MQRNVEYHIMHMERLVASILSNGQAKIWDSQFMPYDLYLEDDTDIDTLVNNLMNFYHWCASRILTLDRKYAKAILNSIGATQATTDKDRANIALSYHCVSLIDVFWVKQADEEISYSNINLYDHPLNAALIDISLRGHQMTVTNTELAQDLSTAGCFPKAWIRCLDGFQLLKDGGEETVRRELIASKICQCFDFKQVTYHSYEYNGQIVTKSDIITSKKSSIVTKMAFDIYAINHDLDTLEECIRIDKKNYFGMNILDYLIGNTDRHPENWGFLVDNETNKYQELYPLMDFNQSFLSYENLDGANCQTVLPRKLTQREAAIEAVKIVGLNQIKEVDIHWFGDWKKEANMFQLRLGELK